MADTKVSALTALTGAGIASDDVVPIVDTSVTTTKKIAISELKPALGICAYCQVLEDGAGNYTLQANSFGVSSILKNGTGDVTVTLSTACTATTTMMPIPNIAETSANDLKITASPASTTTVQVFIRNVSGANANGDFTLVVFGKQ